MKTRSLLPLAAAIILSFSSNAIAEGRDIAQIFKARGFNLDQIELPAPSASFPLSKLKNLTFETLAPSELFPEGPSYRPSDDSYFYAGNLALTRVDQEGTTQLILGKPGSGGTHFLPDGSVLIVGKPGLRRLFPDGRIALLADGEEIGGGNDLTVGKYGEVYFTVPSSGIFRLTPGADGKLEQVVKKGANGLEVDPNGEFVYVVRRAVERYRIHGMNELLGEAETVLTFPAGQGGGDGCTFDAWGNLYSMQFSTGTIRFINPEEGKVIAEIPTGVIPASNLTFGGPRNTDIFVTAGAPKHKNCQVLLGRSEITGFCGHVGATEYPILRFLEEKADPNLFAPKNP